LWSSVYVGTDTFFKHRGLTIFTTYQYSITAKNDFGIMTSEPSKEVTTFGGTPTKAATVTVHSVNHTAIEIRWVTPGKPDTHL